MKICALIVLLAVAGCVKAHCGCLKCSKHLTVVGQSIPVGNCGPAQIIFRDPPGTYEGQVLPVSIQVPIPLGSKSANDAKLDDLNYAVLEPGPVIRPGAVVGSGPLFGPGPGILINPNPMIGYSNPGSYSYDQSGSRYDTKIEAPVPTLNKPSGGPSLTIPSGKLSACVDRVIVPSPPVEYANGQVNYNPVISGGPGPVIIGNTGPAYGPVGPIMGPGPILGPSPTRCSGGGSVSSGPIYNSGGPIYSSGPVGYVGPAGSVGPVGGSGVLVNPYRGNSGSSPLSFSCSKAQRLPSGPVLDAMHKDRVIRYRSVPNLAFVDVVLDDSCVKKQTLDLNENKNLTGTDLGVKSRSKRHIPFIKHGYKFVMNMLPDFIQQPIKNTVNTFALTHPDRKLQQIYRQPPKLTLKEKLQLKNRRKMELLKKKLLGNRNTPVNKASDDVIERRPRNFLLDLEEPIKSKSSTPQKIFSRFSDVDQNLDYDDDKEDIDFSTDKILEILKRTMDENHFDEQDSSQPSLFDLEERSRKSGGPKLKPSKEEYVKFDKPRANRKNQMKYSDTHLNSEEYLEDDVFKSKSDTISQMMDLRKDILMRKLQKLNEGSKRIKRSSFFPRKKYIPNPKAHSVVLDSDQLSLPFYRVKTEDSSEDSKENEHHSHNVRADKNNLREEILRAVIKNELKKFKTEKNDVKNDHFNYNKMIPHSPLYHLLNFPLTLVKTFSEVGSQAIPFVGSIPKMIIGSKKYFRNFGKNFKRNMLHLFSDVVGDFDHMQSNNNVLDDIFTGRHRRSVDQPKQAMDRKKEQYEPDYTLVFGKLAEDTNFRNNSEAKVRKKRYLLKMVDEDEVEEFLMDKLGGIFGYSDENLQMSRKSQPHEHDCPYCHLYGSTHETPQYSSEEKLILQQVKPKLIIDNNGLPFLEINGYKRPMGLGKKKKKKTSKPKQHDSKDKFKQYYSSEETDSDKISYLIGHARDHLETRLTQRNLEMPIQTIKEKLSRQLYETDMLVHMDFEKYDDIYDDLFKIQHVKTAVVQDWKRLLMSRRVNDINGKISLLGKFKEMQHSKDHALKKIAHALSEDCENKFASKNLMKMLVRLQKLQCIINEVVGDFQGKLHMESKFDTEKEIKYVEILSSLNFVNAKTRNDMTDNLKKSRDVALQQNILLLDKLKKLLMYENDHEKLGEQASLLWEMGNIENMQQSTIEEMHQRLGEGYKIKKELKILFDLLKRQEACEMEQKKLLSKFEEGNSEEESSEENVRLTKKGIPTKKKFDIEEFRAKWQERLKKRKMLLKKNLKKTMRDRNAKNRSSDDDEDE